MEWLFHMDDDGLHIALDDGMESFIHHVTTPFVLEAVERRIEPPRKPALGPDFAESFLRGAMQAAWDLGYRPDGFAVPPDEVESAHAAMKSLASALAIERAEHTKTKDQYLADLGLVIRSHFT